jgi:hypothetical protein
MKYIVKINLYNKTLQRYQDSEFVFNTFSEALEYLAIIKKLKDWESVSIVAEKQQ